MFFSEGEPGLRLLDKNEQPRVAMLAADDVWNFGLWDGKGKARAGLMFVALTGPCLSLYDENEKVQLVLYVDDEGAGARVQDEKGTIIWEAPPPEDESADAEAGEE